MIHQDADHQPYPPVFEGERLPRVYFLEAVGLGLVKIGFSRNVPKRKYSVQSSCPVPVRVIGLMKGTEATEKDLHKRFREDQRQGEWFLLSPKIREYIDNNAKLKP
jgi:hypothetical protein